MFNGDPFAVFDNGRCPADRRQRRPVTLSKLSRGSAGDHLLDEGLDLSLNVAGQELALQQNAVFQGAGFATQVLQLAGGRSTGSVARQAASVRFP